MICYSSEFAAIIDALFYRCTAHKKWNRFKNPKRTLEHVTKNEPKVPWPFVVLIAIIDIDAKDVVVLLL